MLSCALLTIYVLNVQQRTQPLMQRVLKTLAGHLTHCCVGTASLPGRMQLRGQSCSSASLLLPSLRVLCLQATCCQVVWEVHCHYDMAAHPAVAGVLACQEKVMLLVMVQTPLWDSEVAAYPLPLPSQLLLVLLCYL
jgi:hypothetical protein